MKSFAASMLIVIALGFHSDIARAAAASVPVSVDAKAEALPRDFVASRHRNPVYRKGAVWALADAGSGGMPCMGGTHPGQLSGVARAHQAFSERYLSPRSGEPAHRPPDLGGRDLGAGNLDWFEPAGPPANDETVAQARTLERAKLDAERLCREFDAGSLYRSVSASSVAEHWSCAKGQHTSACGVDGHAQCDLTESRRTDHEQCD